MSQPPVTPELSRRALLSACSAAGLAGTLFPGALLALLSSPAAEAQAAKTPVPSAPGAPAANSASSYPPITTEVIRAAAAIAAVHLSDDQIKMLLDNVQSSRASALRVRELHLPNATAPVTVTDIVPVGEPRPDAPAPTLASRNAAVTLSTTAFVALDVVQGQNTDIADERLCYLNVRELGELLRRRKVTSTGLTKMYITRLRRLDPTLHFVITITEERALKQAAERDRELAAGHIRGPLHGIPWGGKDLLAAAGYPTTWGAAPYMAPQTEQRFAEDAEVVKRLDAAGAVLIAKLTLGALAQGDLWGPAPGTRTRNPWNPKQGSSGSSAGSASAVAAGCVGFAIGTETLGSISSPSTRCGATGLRPSFGLVPRTGAMALSWSMDKVGPIARSVEDAALVLAAIYGPDHVDQCVQHAAFTADFTGDVRKLRVGYLKGAFDEPTLQPLREDETKNLSTEDRAKREAERRANFERQHYDYRFNAAALKTLRAMGVTLTACELPQFRFGALLNILEAEAADAFDDLTTSGRDALLAGQEPFDWPNTFRAARFVPAVDYIQAQRARSLAIAEMTKLFSRFDVIVAPTFGAQLTATNLTGQPAVIVPNGFRGSDAPPPPDTGDGALNNAGGPGTPVSLTFLAPLYADGKACALAQAYQAKTGFHLKHPAL